MGLKIFGTVAIVVAATMYALKEPAPKVVDLSPGETQEGSKILEIGE